MDEKAVVNRLRHDVNQRHGEVNAFTNDSQRKYDVLIDCFRQLIDRAK
jgi:hypothetical protein